MLRVKCPQNTSDLANVLYLNTQAISNVRKVLPRHMEQTPRCHVGPDKARTDQARRERPPMAPNDHPRRHGLRPCTGGARSGAGAHGRRAEAMPRPRSQAPPGALGSTRQGHGGRVARGRVLRPGAGSGGPERATAAAQPAPPPASCSAAPQQHGRLARSEASRRHRSAQALQSSRRPSCTCGGSRWELGTAAAGAVQTGRRGGRGVCGHGGLGRLAVCTCWLTPTQGRRSHHRSDPARPPRLAADAAMFVS